MEAAKAPTGHRKAKHREVFRLLEDGIRTGRYGPGAQLPTEAKLVEQLGFSRPTIARAMRDLQEMGLVERRPGAGSFVTKVAATERTTGSFGLLVPELGCGDIFDPICAQIARRAQREEIGLIWGDAGNAQLHTRGGVGRLDADADGALESAKALISRDVAGVFFAPLCGPSRDLKTNQQILRMFVKAKVSVVLLDRDAIIFPERSGFDLVSVDHFLGQFRLTQLLVDQGYERVVYLQWPGHIDSLNKRIAGMQACLVRSGRSPSSAKGDPTDADFVSELIESESPDCIMCENDMVATHLLQTLSGLGLSVPNDIGVAGFNDIQLAQHLSTPLTTVRQPCEVIGDVAADVMRQRLNDPNAPPRTVLLEPHVVPRQSTRS